MKHRYKLWALWKWRGNRFDHVWLTGLNEQDWPGSMRPHPFVPVSLQREAGVPEADPADFYQRADNITRRLLGSAADIHLSFSSGAEELGPSRLMASANVREAECIDSIEQAELCTVLDNSGPADGTGLLARGGASIFRNQSQCPFRAYVVHRLAAVREPEQELGLDPSERGTLVHRVLELFWARGGRQNNLSDDEIRTQKLAEAVDRVLAEQRYPAGDFRLAQQELERTRLMGLLDQWLDVEKNRSESFEVEQTELAWAGDISGIEIKFVLDRVDRLASGQQVIIDYKTGRASVNDWFKDRPEEPQLPLYYVALDQQQTSDTSNTSPEGLAFGFINGKEAKLDGVIEQGGEAVWLEPARGTRKMAINSWSELQNHWQNVVDQLADEFKSGHAEVSPSSVSACKYCDLGEVCRIRQIQLPEQSNG